MSICVSSVHNNHDNNDNDMQCTFHSLLPLSTFWIQHCNSIRTRVMKIYLSNNKGCHQNYFKCYFFTNEMSNFQSLIILYVEMLKHETAQPALWQPQILYNSNSIYAQFHAKSSMNKCYVLSIKSFYQTINYLTWINLIQRRVNFVNLSFHQIFKQKQFATVHP